MICMVSQRVMGFMRATGDWEGVSLVDVLLLLVLMKSLHHGCSVVLGGNAGCIDKRAASPDVQAKA